MSAPQISIVIPLFNEAKAFSYLVERLNKIINESDLNIEVVLVDDGSKDETPLLMAQLAYSNERYQCVFLSRNFGHQTALTAGLKYANASEGVMVIDADLQDPPELLETFYKNYIDGYDVSYGVRTMRDDEGFIKKQTSLYFYKTLKKFANIEIPQNSGDFCFISKKVLDVLNNMPEESRFIRGMRAWAGFNQIAVPYERQERVAGETKYTMSKMISFAYNGIFNFSELPIKFITKMGIVAIVIALCYLGYTMFKLFVYGNVIEGFTGLLFSIILFSGVQLLSLGIIGEYIVRIFFQTKQRPLFVISGRIINKTKFNK